MFVFNRKIYKPLLVIFGFVLFSIASYVIGYQVGFKSWGKQISISLDPALSVRGLASTESAARSIATVSNEEYTNPQNLFDKAQILENTQSDSILFVIGNLLHTDEQGNTSFVCKNFSQVQLWFEALGLAIKGEKVIMTINTDCTENKDHQYIGPFSIPAKKILESSIVESTFSENNSEIQFENVSLSWPKSWVLIKADFKKAGTSDFSVVTETPETEDDIFVIEL
ncbi:MAG: hypothetical protein OXK80_02545 [Bdellovibrionales bacterium]|nr:hypothetical protein [Bdellovibrionales bacterium]